ncbi:carbohydrate esterase family 5 protein [Dothidotthia symphoricarpi CBS 119687]|uniref:cutinase n=1 Tax=Dothidotthia symphoricarpi CBS 119687 TaxID=1392245 RepID=A0A6A6AT16_9PLEO|nr:carbohydrate esterase family 5 protein [Dothidotthia symphoricarpi CBS 119687]KAF2134104.1 carbohydrate esterase family 5 protein [Dothidotthia symphoricarpi CBS 119687]
MTQNDLVNGGACKPMTILFARGTTEQGNMGTVAGPPFVSAVGKMMGGATNVAVQGIEYPADVPGFLAGGDKAGSTLMAQMVGQVRTKCPDTSLVIAGYSQGGQLVHNAADMLSADDATFVQSAVIFGDPDNGDAVGKVSAAKTKVICHTGDLICAGQSVILAPHLTYGTNADEAAAFVMSNVAAKSAKAAAVGSKATPKATKRDTMIAKRFVS